MIRASFVVAVGGTALIAGVLVIYYAISYPVLFLVSTVFPLVGRGGSSHSLPCGATKTRPSCA